MGDGEVLGIFGPSGSGKTTLLQIIAGAIKPNGGSIFYKDSDVTATAAKFASYAPGRSSLFDRLFADKRPGTATDTISAIRKLINATEGIALLDDPFCAMSAGEREKAFAMLREKRASIIFASNHFQDVVLFCDRVAVLANGDLQQIGTPQEIYERPESRIVASIVGRNNLFAARRLTSSKADIPEFHTIDGGHRLFAQRIERGALGALNQNVTLAIRPEQISISFGASFPEDNLLKATVKKIQFMGPTTLVELDADGLKLETLVLRVVGLNVGDECMVGLPPDRIQIFKD